MEEIKMFKFFKKKVEVYSPVFGRAVSLEEVPDKMFSDKLLGDGIAFEFQGNTICAPCDGEVMMIAPTKHALGLKLSNKAELMIHIGLDTVNFGGEGFELLVSKGEKVKKGQELVKIDREFFNEQSVNLITPMIITSKEFELEHSSVDSVNIDTVVLKFL